MITIEKNNLLSCGIFSENDGIPSIHKKSYICFYSGFQKKSFQQQHHHRAFFYNFFSIFAAWLSYMITF